MRGIYHVKSKKRKNTTEPHSYDLLVFLLLLLCVSRREGVYCNVSQHGVRVGREAKVKAALSHRKIAISFFLLEAICPFSCLFPPKGSFIVE
jgi:hypothetical protein